MQEMTFRALFEHSSLGILISNEHGVIERANPFALKIFGYMDGELVGQKVEVLIPAPLRERHVGYRQQYIQNPHPRAMGSSLNLKAVKKNGDEFPVEVSLSFFEAPDGRKIVSFVNDITVRKKIEEDLRKMTEELESKVKERTKELSDALLELGHSNAQIRQTLEREKELSELKTRFVSMASHEFRTPLGGIMTSASLIAKYTTTEDAPKREKHIQNIKKSVRNLTMILNDFLSLDKLDQGKVSANPMHFDVTTFISEQVEETRETLERGLCLKVNHESGAIAVFQDKEMVRNVLINLLSNAIKYSPDGKEIFVETKLVGDQFELRIQDHGIGIPDVDQKHLFDRFFRAQNVTNLQGTGLGLNIVKRYVDIMGGSIDFISKENNGTTFMVKLPLEAK